MSLLDRLDVPDAKSLASMSATLSPRDAASNAAPTPVTPPPITRISNVSSANWRSASSRCSGDNAEVNIAGNLQYD